MSSLQSLIELRQLIADANDCLLGKPGTAAAMEYHRKAMAKVQSLIKSFDPSEVSHA